MNFRGKLLHTVLSAVIVLIGMPAANYPLAADQCL